MLSRVIRYSLYGTVGLGGYTAVKYRDDYNSLPVVRFARTAFTAVDIGRTYQSMLYSRDWDRDSEEYRKVKSEAHKIGAAKLLKLCQANKGVYIKLGQHVGALDYLLPSEYVHTMRILHKDAPRNSVEELYTVMREELHREPNELFKEFDEEPLGTASLAQVHRATLHDGSEVAVKIQHHFVRKSINIDLQWIEFIIHTMSRVFPDFQMQWLVDETKKNITKELDFLQEGRNAEKVAEMFKNYSWLKVPRIYWDLSTDKLLVMEYVDGGQVNDVQYIKKHKIDPMGLSRKLGDLYSHMIFVEGYVHCDPHPGNILVRQRAQDRDVTVYLLDHGLYTELTEEFRYDYSQLWLAIIARDRDRMRTHAERLGVRRELFGLFACMVTGRPWDAIMKGIGSTKPSSNEKSTFQKELPNFLPEITECLQQVNRQALMVLKTNDLIRSIEYALGTQHRMPGFLVMTRCCMESVHRHQQKAGDGWVWRGLREVRYGWSLLLLYLYAGWLALKPQALAS